MIDERPLHGVRQISADSKHVIQLHRHLCAEDLLLCDIKFLTEIFLHILVQLLRYLQPDHRHPPALVQGLLHQKAEIIRDLQ